MFYYHKLLRKSNIRKAKRKLISFKLEFDKDLVNYDAVYESFQGWISYAKLANTNKLRNKSIINFEKMFLNKISSAEINKWLKYSK